ncbi:septum formation initiator family protein [Thiotrichales bacterium 19S11-10]|nr:septum formation initiator family protein [Thiotrichales bacterium 19S11-10]
MKIPSINRYLLFGLFLVVCLFSLQYEFWYSESGYTKLKYLEKQNDQLEEVNNQDLLRNQLLEDEIEGLKQDDDVVEGLARKNLGLIKKGETYYQFVPANLPKEKSNDNENLR